MDKFSEYLPLIIIVATLIISVIRKKKEPGKVTQETALPKKTLEEIFEELMPQQPSTEPPQKTVKEIPKRPESRNPVIKREKEAVTFSPKPVIVEPEEEEGSLFSFEDEDDLKRAIIYAEIINKKEY